MAVISGVNGAVYWNEELTHPALANSITFGAGTTGATDQTITSSTAGGATGKIDFETEGYSVGMLIKVSGATSSGNNRIFTINTVSSGVLTVNEAVTTGTDTGVITFLETEPGYEEMGFYNWATNYKVDLLDTTAFDTSSGGRSYISSITNWTASADKYFLSTGNAINDWLGETVKIRFFLNYVSIPSTSSPSHYYEGNTIVTGIDQGTPVDALITQNIGFQGVGALTLKTKTAAWNTTG